ncbi:hypothetical protein AB1K62_05220 [Parasphingorhabdus sp. JC815]|uniref:hypothetical protein n=1 Tax=Parasphingorhabdus sp. JC815 TaxID=3232140 RepID=UPI003457B3D8
MNLKKLAASVAAVSLATAPAMAQSVQSTAPVAERIGATTDAKSQKLQGSTGIIVGVLAAAAVIAGIIIIADDDDDAPTSP